MDPVLLYVTATNREEAIAIARELLAEKLIACANIVDNALSLYWWQGAIEHQNESLIVAKSLAVHVPAITARVKTLHSYSCPCVVSLPLTGGNPEYFAWLETQVNPIAS